MSHWKVRIHQRRHRAEGGVRVKEGIDPDNPQVRKGCLDKKGKYGNRKMAAGAAAMSAKKYGIKFYTYHCKYDSHWHISTTAPWSKLDKRKDLNMNFSARILTSISSTEPSTFSEILFGMNGDRPEDRAGFKMFFETLRALEQSELVEIDWAKDGRLNSAILTPLGAERAREALKGQENGF